jgi:hypothetical protein
LKFKGNLNVVFTTHVLKVAPNHVRFTPGFPPGAGFHGEEFAPAWFETIKKCAMLDQLTNPTVHREIVLSAWR